MKNILYVFPEMDFGGAEKAALLVSEELFERYEYRIYFFFLNKNGKDISLNPNFFVIFNNEGILSRKNNYFKIFISTPIKIIKTIKKYKIDYVISGYEYDIESILIITRLFYRNRNVKFVSILQASLKGRLSEVSSRRKTLFRIVDYLRSYFFNGIIAVSRSVMEELKNSGKEKAIVITNPLDKRIDELSIKMSGSNFENILNKQPYLLNVSRIAKQKNLIFLLRVFNLIKDSVVHNLLLIGAVSDQKVYAELNSFILSNELKDRVFILPPFENVYPVIKNASLITYTSFYEGLPLFILEAMYLKKLIVSTMFLGYKPVLNSSNCYLCSNYDETEYAKLILTATGDNKLKEKLINNAYSDCQKFQVQTVAEMYHNYLNGLT